jgi:hypothetical protein
MKISEKSVSALEIGLECIAYLNLAFVLGFTVLPVRAGYLVSARFDWLYDSLSFMSEFAIISSLLLFFWAQLVFLVLTWKKISSTLKWRRSIALAATLVVLFLGFPLYIGFFVRLP